MIAALALALLSQDSPVVARVDVEPRTAEIGQPLTLILTATHAPRARLELPSAEELLPEDASASWILLETGPELTTPHPRSDELHLTVARWEIASLEPGERAFPFPDVRWTDGARAGFATFEAPTVTVAAALAEGEDAPRPALGFRDPVFEPAPLSDLPLYVLGGFGLLVAFVVWRIARRFGKRPADERQVVLRPRARLESLERASEPAHVRERYFDIARLVREVVDEAGNVDRGALTDEEWLDAVRVTGRISDANQCQLRELLAECESVKYAQKEPTGWALEDTLKEARALAAGLESANDLREAS